MPEAQDLGVRQAQQEKQLKEAAKMYEQHFLREMVKAMRKTVPEGEFLKANFAEKLYQEQLDHQYVDAWSESGGVGLADMIYDQIKMRYFSEPQIPVQGPIHLKSAPLPVDKSLNKEPPSLLSGKLLDKEV